MPNPEAIRWFKTQFQDQIEAAVRGTPFTVDLLTAIACQETGYIWNILRKKVDKERVLALCVGDTLDSTKGRKAFPKNKTDLLAAPNGQAMFDIARQALVDMAKYIPGYQGAVANPAKFCRGFGIFQHDLQFFLKNPGYFLEKKYADFDSSLAMAVGELRTKLRVLGWSEKSELTELEMVAVAIAYNTGRYTPSKGLKQGYFNGTQYYGEAIFDYLRLARTVKVGDRTPEPGPAARGEAPIPPPTPLSAKGATYEVDVRETMLNVRSEPLVPPSTATSNVVGRLPDGHIVKAVGPKRENGFIEVETSLNGALIRGFVASKYLKSVSAEVEVVAPEVGPDPTKGIRAVYMPRKSGNVTVRTQLANAHSLNESGQPGRKGMTAETRRAEIAVIIDWLAVDDPRHKRYQPRRPLTFCNIYAHDYCHLAGCYLPRVWWTGAAIEALASGRTAEPLYGKTIEEQRANDLFRWLRDFGARFGWRQTGTLTKLQTEVNQGAVGLIIARRVNDGLSGHVVAVVPETDDHRARRNTAGEVIAPLQSQAGLTNFRYGTGKIDWWRSTAFAEFSFWLHG